MTVRSMAGVLRYEGRQRTFNLALVRESVNLGRCALAAF
ncbi:hypothetical protein [Polaromonas sp. CG9_12]|nr:hypothetical protein [Polaromonas sp. CG9_12]